MRLPISLLLIITGIVTNTDTDAGIGPSLVSILLVTSAVMKHTVTENVFNHWFYG